MVVHYRVTPNIKFDASHLFIGVERGTVRVKCLAQEHNRMFPARAPTGSFDRTNHRASTHALLTSSSLNSSTDIASQKEKENEALKKKLRECERQLQEKINASPNDSRDANR